MRIALDAGHGAGDVGVVDARTGNTEKYANLITTLTLKHLLVGAGHDVVLTRATDTYPPLADRTKVTADLLVSVHFDWEHGRSLLYHAAGATSARSAALGERITKALGIPLWSSTQSRFGGLYIDAFRGPALLWEVARLVEFEPSKEWRVEKCAAFVAALRSAW